MSKSMNLAMTVSLALSMGALAAAGCRSSAPASVGGGPPPGAQLSIDNGIQQLTNARCDREERCGHVGAGKTFETRDNCLTVMRGRATEDLQIHDCRGGIDERGMSECLNVVRGERCADPIDKLSRMKECRVSEICFR